MQTLKALVLNVTLLMTVATAQTDSKSAGAFLDAARKGDLAAVRAALEAGIDVNTRSEYGATALSLAAGRGHIEIIKLLIERGADVNARDNFYQGTALVWATMNDQAEAVRLLLTSGAEGADDTLMMAVAQKKPDILRAVIASKKATPDALKNAHKSAESTGSEELVAIFKEADIPLPEGADTVHLSPDVLARYAGKYKSEQIGMEITFTANESNLTGAATGQPPLTYAPTDATTFEAVEFPGIRVIFEVKDGAVPSMVIEQGGRRFVFDRVVEEAKPAVEGVPTEAKVEIVEPARPVTKPRPWPSFRGERAAGNGDGQGAVTQWDVKNGKNVLWKTEIPGLGHASPVVWGDKVFIATAISSDPASEFRHGLYGDVDSAKDESVHTWKLYCLDRQTGKILWEQTAHKGVPRSKRHIKASHASCTPATDGQRVVVSFGSEGLYAYDFEGSLLWKKDLGVLSSGWFFDPDYEWGFSSSPIIHDDRVILQCDLQKDSFIAAFDVKDGSEVWRTPREEIPSWGTPTIFESKGRADVVTNSTKHIYGYDPKTGKERWRLGGNSEVTVGTPVVGHDLVFITGGYPPVRPIYAVKASATGDITLKDDEESSEHVAWASRRDGTYMPTPIIYGDHLYTLANQGILTVYKATTGERMYRVRVEDGRGGGYTASPVAADDRIYLTSEDGLIFVIQAGPEYKLLATNDMGEVCMSTPAISNGTIVVRTIKHVFGIGAPAKP